mmetsp:Transcript_40099/g.114295  ORF Transcript_40099/g.114295 Transcript_40099/m.114295 type:complete len:309 (+) Transcript_40099:2051-2977(+)
MRTVTRRTGAARRGPRRLRPTRAATATAAPTAHPPRATPAPRASPTPHRSHQAATEAAGHTSGARRRRRLPPPMRSPSRHTRVRCPSICPASTTSIAGAVPRRRAAQDTPTTWRRRTSTRSSRTVSTPRAAPPARTTCTATATAALAVSPTTSRPRTSVHCRRRLRRILASAAIRTRCNGTRAADTAAARGTTRTASPRCETCFPRIRARHVTREMATPSSGTHTAASAGRSDATATARRLVSPVSAARQVSDTTTRRGTIGRVAHRDAVSVTVSGVAAVMTAGMTSCPPTSSRGSARHSELRFPRSA